ncbi:GPI ethanolamine phosphate transferase 2-like isoform X1 [Xenia sp. Carnegie-2017]|nr:GPI ethanolamine phosphate transferase 2-like isoform X1 [Xenia sp. Carnegie-2017]
MILHYLGLDHIGHLAGPNSPLVRPKLREMDEIIHRIYETIVQQDFKRNISTLLVLCGDHGMSDGGSHGGSSFAETTTPLVFMSSLFAQGKGNVYDATKWVDQIDITPTLALLLGLSIPKNSFGILIPDLFNYHSVRERLEAIRMNALQISTVYMRNTNNESVVELDLALRFHDELIKKFVDKNLERDAAVEKIEKLYFSGMKKMAEKLTKFMSSYDFYSLYVAISLLLLCFIGSIFLHLELYPKILYEFFQTHFSFLSIAFFVFTTLISYSHFYLCTSPRLGTSEILCSSSTLSYSLSWTFITITVMASLSFLSIVINIYHHGVPTWHRESSYILKGTCTFLLLGILLHNISLLSTSFIEEEHQTWYFLTTTYHSIVFFKICSERWKMNYQFCSPDNVKRPTNNTSSSESTDKIVLRNNMSNLKVCDHTSTVTITALCVFFLLICDRTLRSWNQTGIKWSEEPDIEDWLINPERNIVLSLLIIISLVGITLILFDKTRIKDDPYEFIAFVSEIISVYIFRATTGTISFPIVVESRKTGKNIARFIYCCVIVMLLRRVFAKTRAVNIGESIICAYVLLITLLLRTHNIPTVLIMLLQARIHHQVVWSRCFTNLEVILSAYYMGWLTYFAQGNSNSLATVDISAGYIGLGEDYWPLTVALLTTLATFSGPLFWLLQAMTYICRHRLWSLSKCLNEMCTALLFIKSLNLTVYTILSYINCYHLFIWSVFAPKLLYEAVTSLIFAIFILVLSLFSQMCKKS